MIDHGHSRTLGE